MAGTTRQSANFSRLVAHDERLATLSAPTEHYLPRRAQRLPSQVPEARRSFS